MTSLKEHVAKPMVSRELYVRTTKEGFFSGKWKGSRTTMILDSKIYVSKRRWKEEESSRITKKALWKSLVHSWRTIGISLFWKQATKRTTRHELQCSFQGVTEYFQGERPQG